MSALKQFENQNYLNLETVRKNGEPVPTPVWFVIDNERIYVRTIAGSGKMKRIRNHPAVRIMPCGRAGEPLGTWITANAYEIPDEATFAHVRDLLTAKYGEMVRTFEEQARARGDRYTIVSIEPGN